MLFFVSFINAQEIIEQNEEFDPLTLNEPPVPLMNKSAIYEIISENGNYSEGNYYQNKFREIEKEGWKIQLISTKDFYEADSLKKMAEKYFPNETVESLYNSPYYKIRLGNCSKRSEAQKLLKAAIRREFYAAWIIPTKIKVKEKISINK